MFARVSLPACSCSIALVRAPQNSAAARRVLRLGALHSSAGASAAQPSVRFSSGGSSAPPPSSPRPSRSGRARSAAVAAAIAAVGGGAWWCFSTEEERLSEQRFVPLKIKSVERITADTSIFKLALPKSMLSASGPSGPILSLYLMQPDLQIQRPYTPLSSAPFARDGPDEVELLIKRYDTGELSRWMHRLGPGDEVRVRGPVVTWDYREGAFDEVVFIVGGTGITPAYQLLEYVLAQPSPPKISVIYASPSPSGIFLKPALDAFVEQNSEKVSINYLVDRLDPGVKAGAGLHVGSVDRKVVDKLIGRGGVVPRRIVVVCGPEGMVNHVAGPRARDLSQGPVGGILGQLGYTTTEVVKL